MQTQKAIAANTATIDATLHALSDPTRRQILEMLGKKPCRAGELATATGVSASRTSKHLRVLLEAGLARDERPASDARARVFYLRAESLAHTQRWLEQLRSDWDRQLQSFKAHAERRKS